MDLGTETDRLNESFEQLEGALTALDFGVSARVELGVSENGRTQQLAFKKTEGGWKLMIERGDESFDLLKTSRLTRLLAAEKVDELFLRLRAEKDRQLADVSNAIAKVDAVTREAIDQAGHRGMCPKKIEEGVFCGLRRGHSGECRP